MVSAIFQEIENKNLPAFFRLQGKRCSSCQSQLLGPYRQSSGEKKPGFFPELCPKAQEVAIDGLVCRCDSAMFNQNAELPIRENHSLYSHNKMTTVQIKADKAYLLGSGGSFGNLVSQS